MYDGMYEAVMADLDDSKLGYMTTFSGEKFYPMRPKAEAINIYDIAHALANTCRWSGHIKQFYSVAQHSYKVMEIVPQDHKLAALLHDASEAYLGDMIRPIKYLPEMAIYKEIEANATAAIAEAFGFETLEKSDEVDKADQIILAQEAIVLRTGMFTWPQESLVKLNSPLDFVFGEIWEPETAKAMFLRAFYELVKPHNGPWVREFNYNG